MWLSASIIFMVFGFFCEGISGEENNVKEGKVFSIFSIVQFKNTGCASTMTSSSSGQSFRNGTCLTNAECLEMGGASSGSCAGGFGVCCVFMKSACGSTINQNCSYIKNPGFSAAYTSTSNCQFTINKCDNSVCDFRLDFDTFTTNGPASTEEVNGGECQDSLTISTNTGQSVPVICGENSGQHMYLDVGTAASDSATFAFTFANAFSRFWDIKITQIPCNVRYDPPNGCLQYHTGIDGRFTTFNWGSTPVVQHLRNQDYRICIRQEEGYCCIIYMQCTDANSFTINPGTGGNDMWTMGKIQSNCAEDYIGIEASSQSGFGNTNSVYCGGFLNDIDAATTDAKIKDCTSPFAVSVVTDGTTDAVPAMLANSNKGVCLEYTQEPCAAGNPGP